MYQTAWHYISGDRNINNFLTSTKNNLYCVLPHHCLHVLLLLLPPAEEALKVLKELEDQQDMHNPTLKYTEPARVVMDNIFETIKSFCGPSYK
jgi:hypothetical protein